MEWNFTKTWEYSKKEENEIRSLLDEHPSSIIVTTVHFWTSLRFELIELRIKYRSNIFHMNTNQS